MKKQHILWADDDPDDLLLMRHVLEDLGDSYNITEVNNGRQALDFLAKRKDGELPCLIILDMNMPVLNGREALAIIKKEDRLKNIPLVIFTTSNSELDKMYCQRYGVKMVTKPPQYNELKMIVRQLVNYCTTK